jgi:hypothetical protein
MKITIVYSPEEGLPDREIQATDFFLAFRHLAAVADKESRVPYSIPVVTTCSTDGGNFREILKELRQALIELERQPTHGSPT